MIVDCLKNWGTYFSGGEWKSIFDFLNSLKTDAEEKEYTLQGRDIFARVMSYETRLPELAVLETHRKYIDIQAIIFGTEGMEWFPFGTLEVKIPYDGTKDVEFYHRPSQPSVQIDLCPGMFVVLFPKDAHMTQLIAGNVPQLVKKVVVKVNTELLKP